MRNKKVLVTGAAGFIGFHLVRKLSSENYEIIGLDNLNEYYDAKLKYDRLKELGISLNKENKTNSPVKSNTLPNFSFIRMDITDMDALNSLFSNEKFEIVIHLAAQAGVRYSIEAPEVYIQSNIIGFFNVLECSKKFNAEHLIYASSSSVYGNNDKVPFAETDNVDFPVSMYAATKKSNELMAHTFSHIHKLPTTGLRFFTVYGPWGRPDMAAYLFTKSILEGKPIKVFNQGNLYRDFTYVDDIIDGIKKLIVSGPDKNGYALYNIGNNKPVHLLNFISAIEKYSGKEAIKELHPMQPGDVYKTFADIDAISEAVGYKPSTDIEEGIKHYVKWFKDYYKI